MYTAGDERQLGQHLTDQSPTSGKKKACQHKLFGPVALRMTPALSLGQTHAFSLFCTVEFQGQTQLWGRREANKVYVLKVYVPFLLTTQYKEAHNRLEKFNHTPLHQWQEEMQKIAPKAGEKGFHTCQNVFNLVEQEK